MKYILLLAFLLIGAHGSTTLADPPAEVSSAVTKAAPQPEDCVLAGPEGAAASVEYRGKTYYYRDSVCKDEFLTDPERYSQLYDALLELKAQGKTIQKPKSHDAASLVPS